MFGLLALAAVLSLLALAAARPLANRAKEELESAVSAACEPCELKIENASLGFSPPDLRLNGISFRQGDPRDSAVSFDAASAEIPLPLYNLSGAPWLLGTIRVSGLHVTVHEGDLSLKKKAKPPSEGKPLELEVAGISVSGGAFTYRKDSPAGSGFIRLTDIAADIGPFGTYGEWLEKPLTGEAVATLERSGRVDLKVASRLDKEGPFVDVSLSVKALKLREMNAYFRPEEGVSLAGQLLEAEGKVKVRDRSADGLVVARYEGLELEFHANRHRGALEALFTNLGAAIKVNQGNSREPRRERLEAVVTRRHERESVVSFILRTLKEAMLRVAT